MTMLVAVGPIRPTASSRWSSVVKKSEMYSVTRARDLSATKVSQPSFTSLSGICWADSRLPFNSLPSSEALKALHDTPSQPDDEIHVNVREASHTEDIGSLLRSPLIQSPPISALRDLLDRPGGDILTPSLTETPLHCGHGRLEDRLELDSISFSPSPIEQKLPNYQLGSLLYNSAKRSL